MKITRDKGIIENASAPTSADVYRVGTIWVDTTNDLSYTLTDVTAGVSTWLKTAGIGSGSIDLEGDYLLDDQTTTNMMSKGAVYRFDGTDDTIVVPDDASITDILSSGGSASAWVYPVSDGENDAGYIMDKGTWIINVTTEVSGYVPIKFTQVFSGDNGIWTTGAVLPLNTWSHVRVVYDASAVGNDPIIYLNAIPQTITEASTPTGTFTTDSGTDFTAGNNAGGTIRTWDGSIAEVELTNFAPTAAEVKDLISGNIPFKWQYGSQTELVTEANDRTFGGAVVNWAAWSGGAIVTDTGEGKITFDTGGAYSGAQIASVGTLGKMFRITMDMRSDAGEGDIAGILVGFDVNKGAVNENFVSLTSTEAGISVSAEVFGGIDTFALQVGINEGTGQIIFIDNVSVVELGAVALYDQTSISETTWYDKANGNDGAVTGAEVLNDADSIASTFAWHVGGFDFNWSTLDGSLVGNSGTGAIPITLNDNIFAPVNVPRLLNGKQIVIDQITVYYFTDASGDDFDFSLTRTDQDGTTTTDAALIDIGSGETGNQSATILSSAITLSDFAYYVKINVTNTNATTDVIIYDIKFEGHLA